MNIQIEIKTQHLPTVFNLQNDAPDWADIYIPPVKGQRNGLSENWAIAIVSIVALVPTEIIVSWLKNKITDKKRTIVTINRKQVDLDKGEIIRIIEETKKIEK